ncbi:MAG: NeuD/PglB/VioB family sugar acetyltransferase [Candidatus Thorarchaeota archaeon]
MMKKLIIIGGVGNGTVVSSTVEDIMRESHEWELLGFLDDRAEVGEELNGFPVLGRVDEAHRFNSKDCYFIYTMIRLKQAYERIEKLRSLGINDEKFATLWHPTAVISRNVRLGYGVVLMPGVIISPDVTIGNHTQLYANSFVGHNTTVGDYCFIANNASIGGNITVENGVHIGSNCSVNERVVLGEWSLIGLGSVVLQDVEPFTKVVGNPTRSIGSVNKDA